MNKKCPNCNLVNFPDAEQCTRCGGEFVRVFKPRSEADGKGKSTALKILSRALICIGVCVVVITGFYMSLLSSATPLKFAEREEVKKAVKVLDEKGFAKEVFLLNSITNYRSDDNWLNASVPKENAYAATNFPFEIMTLYPDFFTYPIDETERAAILLHEAQHLQGADEKTAYEYVWKNRAKLGWTKERYSNSIIWLNVRKQTKELVPSMFVCTTKDFGDCTAD